MDDKLYPDLKWLVSQKQWKAYEEWLDSKVRDLTNIFYSGKEVNSEEIRIRGMAFREAVNAVKQDIEDYEFDIKSKEKT